MAGNRISVQLDFTANTSQAENALKSLQTSLNHISHMGNLDTRDVGMANKIMKASEAAIQLRQNLQSAMDVNTGKLNLAKLNQEMDKSGMSLQKYATQLAAIGPEGRQAFMQLTNAIVASETPLRQSNMLVDKLWDTLKRTAGWQLSSSMIHGFMSGVQTAYNYAQDLNRSLNDIRIVTGYSADKMAEFAQQANKAAKALSTTTTDYTKASLIYFQQGLNDQEVKERTDVTVKMANVTQTSAEQVSQQMTAVWNNFDDGSKSLEYYADVMTALGAATASSTDEIAEGLEKFAAVADTVGLSYEYATAALATVTATTRQSASIVGTAFKTLFARIEGLKLGETLDDGTSLNKYSEALASVGVNIKDTSGEMKQMDTILNETAEVWSTLSKDQQVALAQTVAGVRQYTQFIALMDNWDFMEENLKTVAGAEGELQKQADIYAESWEAAQKRVQAAAEALYDDLLNDKFFIGITNIFGGFLDVLDKIIDRLGGMGTILPGLVILIDKLFGNKIQAGITVMGERLSMLTASGREKRAQADANFKDESINTLKTMRVSGLGMQETSATEASYRTITELQSTYVKNAEKMTEQERALAQMLIQRQQAISNTTIEMAKQVDLSQREFSSTLRTTRSQARAGIGGEEAFSGTESAFHLYDTAIDEEAKVIEQAFARMDPAFENIIQDTTQFSNLLQTGFVTAGDIFDQLISDLQDIERQFSVIDVLDGKIDSLAHGGSIKEFTLEWETLSKELEKTGVSQDKIEKLNIAIQGLKDGSTSIETVRNAMIELTNSSTDLGQSIEKVLINKFKLTQTQIDQLRAAAKGNADELLRLAQAMVQAGQAGQTAASSIAKMQGAISATTSKISNWTQGISAAVMSMSMLKNAVETLNDPDATEWEKFSTIIMSLGMAVPVAMNAINGLANSTMLATALQKISNSVTARSILVTGEAATTEAALDLVRELNAIAIAKETGFILSNDSAVQILTMAKKGLTAAEIAEALGFEGSAAATAADTIQKWLNVKATLAAKAATWGLVAGIAALVIGLGALTLYLAKHASMADQIAENNDKVNKKYEEQIKLLDKIQSTAEEVTKTFDDMTNAANRYGDARKVLDNMAHSATEYKDKLQEANGAAKELIETLGLTFGKGYDIQNGQYIINTDSSEYKEKYQKQQQKNQMAQSAINGIEYQKTSTEKEKYQTTQTYIAAKYKYGNYTDLGANQGAYQNIQMTQEAFSVGEDIYKKILDGAAAANVDDIEAYIKENTKAIWGEAKELSDQEVANIAKNVEKIKSLSQSQYEIYSRAIVDTTLNQNPGLTSYLNTDIINSTVGKIINADMDNFDKAISEKLSNKNYVDKVIDMLFPDGFEITEDQKNRNLTEEQAKTEVAAAVASGEVIQEYVQQALPEIQKAVKNSIIYDSGLGQVNQQDEADYLKAHTNQNSTIAQIEQLKKDFESNPANLKVNFEIANKSELEEQFTQIYSNNYTSDITGSTIRAQQEVDRLSDTSQWTSQEWNDKDLINDLIEQQTQLGHTKEEIWSYISAMKEASMTAEEWNTKLQNLQEILNEGIAQGLDATEIEHYAGYLQSIALKTDDLADSLIANDEAATELARSILRMNKGIAALNENWKTWKGYLADVNDLSIEGYDAMQGVKSAVADLLDVSVDMVSDDFIRENLELIEKAANNDADAIDNLSNKMAQISADNLVKIAVKAELEEEDFLNQLSNFRAFLDSLEPGEYVSYADLDDTSFIDSLNEMLAAGVITKDQLNAQLAGIHMEAHYKTEPVDLGTQTVEQYDYVPTVTDAGGPVSLDSEGNSTFQPKKISYRVRKVGSQTIKTEGTAAAMTTGEGTPVIDGITKTGGSGKSNFGSLPKGKTGGSGGSGGKGGGGSKQKKKDLTKRDDVVERYHRIEDTIDNLTKQYDKLSNATEHAFGSKKLKLMDQQIAKLKQVSKAEGELGKEIEKYLDQDRTAVINIGAKIDENGVITNYEELAERWLKKQNDLENSYNAGTIDDEAFDEGTKDLNEEKKILDQYEETWDKWLEQQDKIAEAWAKIIQAELDKIDIEVNLQLDTAEIQSTVNDYLKDKLQDETTSLTGSISNVMDSLSIAQKKFELHERATRNILQNMVKESRLTEEQYEALFTSIQNGSTEALNEIAAAGKITQEEMDALGEHITEMYNNLSEGKSLIRELKDIINEAMTVNNKAVQDQIRSFDHLSSAVEHYKNIIDLIGKNNLKNGKALKDFLFTQDYENSKKALEINKQIFEQTKQQYELTKKAREEERKLVEARMDPEALREYDILTESTLREMEANVNEARDAYLSSLEDTLEKAKDKFENIIEDIGDDFAKAIGGMSFEGIQEKIGLIQDANRDRYLADYKALYEINKLNRDLQKAMDDTDNISAKNKLSQLQKEINKEAGDYSKITEHDLEYLQKQFEIQKARIALEEAQNAKNTVRLRRDNEGNWGYVYTADEDTKLKAQDDYEKTLIEMAETQDKYLDEMSQQYYETLEEYFQKQQEIMSDVTLSEEERKERLDSLAAFYEEKLGFITNELEKNVDRNQELYNNDMQAFYDMTGQNIALNTDLQISFEKTMVGLINAENEAVQDFAGLAVATTKAVQTMQEQTSLAYSVWQQDINNAKIAAGAAEDDMNSFTQIIVNDMGLLSSNADDAKDKLSSLFDEIEKDFNEQAARSFANIIGTYVTSLEGMENRTKSLTQALLALRDAMTEKIGWSNDIDYSAKMMELIKNRGYDALNAPEFYEYSQARIQKVQDTGRGTEADAIQYDNAMKIYARNVTEGRNTYGEMYDEAFRAYLTTSPSQAPKTILEVYKVENRSLYEAYVKILKKYLGENAPRFAAGGLATFTGPAWLDGSQSSPELVLNPNDTKNFLLATEMLRTIMDQLNFQANWMSMGAMNLSANIPVMSGDQVLQQHVSIEATFPNVQDSNEIEEAFNNLINAASQYANRKN